MTVEELKKAISTSRQFKNQLAFTGPYKNGVDLRQKFDFALLDGEFCCKDINAIFSTVISKIMRFNGVLFITNLESVWWYWAELRGQDQDFLMFSIEGMNLGVIDFSVKQNGTLKYFDRLHPQYILTKEFYDFYRAGLANEVDIETAKQLLKI